MEHDLIVVVLCNEKSKVTNSLKRPIRPTIGIEYTELLIRL